MKVISVLIALGFLNVSHCCDAPPPRAINLARNGFASQSSVYLYQVMGYARQAIDGNSDGIYDFGSCSHTSKEKDPWWKVDLHLTYKISTIIIAARQDCCSERLIGAEVRVGNSPDVKTNPVCGTITGVVPAVKISVCCNGMEGQYVGVTIPSREDYLTLCEVEIYGQMSEPHVCW
ncbi:fucolectin-6-like [Pelobates fuscus]|uniref:fucolectin-6-like n=1 Tax=Pelobates fuscus TaxID=191477 RepID=UPI002FE479C9